jgi:uncharacterized protein with PIN domain
MGISIKRAETERLAGEVARLNGESLTDAIHHALESELARLDEGRRTPEQIEAKGRHPARLNLGDSFAYALATVSGEPLLCKGNDFAQTDVALATA